MRYASQPAMALEDPQQPFRPKESLHIPTPVIGAVVALLVVLVLTIKGFSDSLQWLVVLVAIPAGIYFLSHPAAFLAIVLVASSAKMWLPFLPLDLPVDILMRACLLVAVVGGAVIRKDVRRTTEPYRIAAYCFLLLMLVIMVRRGAGFYQLGGSLWGGKVYIILLVNFSFLLLVPGTITMSRKAWTWTLALALSGPIAVVLADALYAYSGGRFYYLYYLFRPASTVGSTAFELGQQDAGIWRLQSFSQLKLSWLAMLLFPWLKRSPLGWLGAFLLVLLHLGLTALSGFRAALAVTPVYIGVYLYLAYPRNRTRLFALGAGALAAGLLAAYTIGPLLPTPAQRAISWLPGIQVDARAAYDATHSSNWRLDLWHLIWQREVPKHLWVGKGLAYNPQQLIDQSEVQVDYWVELSNFIVMGEYHNGPLILLVAFGIPGLCIMLAFFFFAWRRGLRHFRSEWGDPYLRNFFLVYFALYTVGVLSFLFIFGDMQAALQQLLTHALIMELLAKSDPKLSKPAEEKEVRKLVHRAPAKPERRVALPPLFTR